MTATKQGTYPYQLSGPAYALWQDCRVLGIAVQAAVDGYLCEGHRIVLGCGVRPKPLDECSRHAVIELADKRGITIPPWAFEVA